MTPEEEAVFCQEIAEAQAKKEAEHEQHLRWAIRRSFFNWRSTGACRFCHEWVGHWGGGPRPAGDTKPAERCDLIPDDLWLDELRPNCFDVRRHRIGDAIRHATTKGST